jgi:hypothetical protein
LGHGLFRIVGRSKAKRDDLCINAAVRLQAMFERGPVLAQPAERLVDRDPREPGGKTRLAANSARWVNART